LRRFETVCLMQPSRVMPAVAEAVGDLGNERQTVYVEKVSTPQEWITTDLTCAAERSEYFSLALIRYSETSTQRQLSGRGQVLVVAFAPGVQGLLTRRAVQLLGGAAVLLG